MHYFGHVNSFEMCFIPLYLQNHETVNLASYAHVFLGREDTSNLAL